MQVKHLEVELPVVDLIDDCDYIILVHAVVVDAHTNTELHQAFFISTRAGVLALTLHLLHDQLVT